MRACVCVCDFVWGGGGGEGYNSFLALWLADLKYLDLRDTCQWFTHSEPPKLSPK